MNDGGMFSQHPAVEVRDLSKAYRLYERPIDRLKETLHPFKKKYHAPFWALRNVTLRVPKGETWGIIGLNGSGKSTLLKMICGVSQPTAGEVRVTGRISALLELGTGFNPEFTGRQNIFFVGALQGFDHKDMKRRCEEVIRFADIGEFIDQPVKSYSSGMLVRLAFSVAVNVDPDILVVDEALAVGDVRFQHKCLAKMRQFRGLSTILFVSHDLSAILTFCDKVAWMHHGELLQVGRPKDVIEDYTEAVYEGVKAREEAVRTRVTVATPSPAEARGFMDRDSFGRGQARILDAWLSHEGRRVDCASPGQDVALSLRIAVVEDMDRPIVGFLAKNGLGLDVFGFNTHHLGTPLRSLQAGENVRVDLGFRWPNVQAGPYALTVGVAVGELDEHVQQHLIHHALVVECLQEKNDFNGMTNLEGRSMHLEQISEE